MPALSNLAMKYDKAARCYIVLWTNIFLYEVYDLW